MALARLVRRERLANRALTIDFQAYLSYVTCPSNRMSRKSDLDPNKKNFQYASKPAVYKDGVVGF